MWNCNVDESWQRESCPLLYADPLSTTSDTMDARMDSIDSATDTRGSDEPWIKLDKIQSSGLIEIRMVMVTDDRRWRRGGKDKKRRTV